MYSVRSVLDCFFWNLRMLRRNPRLILSLIMGFLICFLLTEKTISLSLEFLTNIQIFEPFIWCFADSDSILFSSLALILLLTQFPRLDPPAAYLIFRTNRLNWVLGQVLTAIFVSVAYTAFLLFSSILLTAGNAFFDNRWSDTATLLSFSPASFEVALTVVRKTIKLTAPYTSCFSIFLLLLQYTLFLTTLHLTVSLRRGKKAGLLTIMTISLLSYLLTPDRFMTRFLLNDNLAYVANLASAWLSPLQHATYIMHNFGYDRLPTLLQTHALFGIANLSLVAASFAFVSKTTFNFSGGYWDV